MSGHFKYRKAILAAAILLAAGICRAGSGFDSQVRLSWDKSTYSELASILLDNVGISQSYLIYPRVRRMSDGALLMSFMNHEVGFDIMTARSHDGGKTWTESNGVRMRYPVKSTVGDDKRVFTNPDFIELKDGRVMMVYQWRNSKGYGDIAHTNENCGIEMCISRDKGLNWDEPRIIYTGRCWEPSLLELPSGEIQCYLTDSQDTREKVSWPRTSLIRSFDGGKTWQGKPSCDWHDTDFVTRTVDSRWAYDGMPSAVLVSGGKGILVPVEVWHSKLQTDQTPVVVKTGIEDNWSQKDKERMLAEGGPDYPAKKMLSKHIHGYAPYAAALPSGEILVSCGGQYRGQNGFWVLVGDADGDNFHHATTPFLGSWGSISYIGDDRVIAAAGRSYTPKGSKEQKKKILLMQARLNYSKVLKQGKLKMKAVDLFDAEKNDWWFLGKKFDSQVFYNFAYTGQGFQWGAYCFDKYLSSYTQENADAPIIFLARADGRQFRLIVNAEGDYSIYEDINWSWVKTYSGKSRKIDILGTLNDDSDSDLGYSVLLDIPWDQIGGTPVPGEDIRIHPSRMYKARSIEDRAPAWEELDGEDPDHPEEWLKITLN